MGEVVRTEIGGSDGEAGGSVGLLDRDRAVTVAILFAAAVVGTFRIRAYDTFWHLEAGQWMLRHGELLRFDPFRFTSGGAPWIDHEWLSQLIFAGVEALGGLAGLGLLRAAVTVALVAVLVISFRRLGLSAAVAGSLALAAVWLARPRLLLRPELFTLLGLALLLALLEGWRRGGGRWRLWAVPLLVVPWVNLHPGALAAPPLVAAHLLGARLRPAPGERRPRWREVIGLPVVCLLALLVNPFGSHVFEVPRQIADSLAGIAAINPEWEPLWRAPRPAVLVVLTGLGLLVGRRLFERRLPDLATGAVAALTAVLVVESVRHQGLFFLAAAFFVARELATAAPGSFRVEPRLARGAALAFAAAVVFWCLWPPSVGPLSTVGAGELGLGLETDRYPEQPVDTLISDWPEIGPLYNDLAFGGYLLWRTFPQRQVFIDGRNEVDPALLREIDRSWFDGARFRQLLDRWQIDGALLAYDDRLLEVVPPGGTPGTGNPSWRTPSALLFPEHEWALVAWDDAGMLYVRRTPERRQRLEASGWHFLHPEDWRESLRRAAIDPRYRSGLEAELERKLEESPGSERAGRIAAALAGLPE